MEQPPSPVFQPPSPAAGSKGGALRTLLLGGILPVIIFTVVEEYFGTLWGLVAGMVFGVGEIAVEWRRNRRVETITWAGNGLILVLGGISLFTQEGVWFKLQPAFIEAAMAIILMGSCLVGRPFLVEMMRKQGMMNQMPPVIVPLVEAGFAGLTFRVGIFFLAHAVLATWAALYWSTRAWAILKGVGFTGSMILYTVGESLILRRRIRRAIEAMPQPTPPPPR